MRAHLWRRIVARPHASGRAACRPQQALINSPFQITHDAAKRCSSSASRWKARQSSDAYAKEARAQGLKARAAFKLIEINDKHRLLRRGQTVVDLGFAPGSWSQVAAEAVGAASGAGRGRGRVVGLDLLPAEAPAGVKAFRGDFLSPAVREGVRRWLLEMDAAVEAAEQARGCADEKGEGVVVVVAGAAGGGGGREGGRTGTDREAAPKGTGCGGSGGRMVDVVLSDMMMNTSGIAFKDHAGSMDLCSAALIFASDTLKPGGHFVCKFYQGSEDKKLELSLKKMFEKVYRDKPKSSRSESKEAYFVAMRRKGNATFQGLETDLL